VVLLPEDYEKKSSLEKGLMGSTILQTIRRYRYIYYIRAYGELDKLNGTSNDIRTTHRNRRDQ
jgi:hypothetical protein